ncbi:hypothetical protein ES703_122922 [subsurface metagenome]
MSSKSLIDTGDGVDMNSGTLKEKIKGYGRNISNMVIMLVSDQDCLEFLLSREGQA